MKRGLRVPIIAVFYGIVIRMYFQQSEHNPPHPLWRNERIVKQCSGR